MLLFAVGQQTGGWRKTLLMLLLLLLLQLPGLQGLLSSDGVTEPKVNRFILAKKRQLYLTIYGPTWFLCNVWDAKK